MHYDAQSEEKAAVRAATRLILQRDYPDFKPIHGPVAVSFEFHLDIPRFLSKNKREQMEASPHSIRPDLDNLIKFVKDALNEVLWVDDSNIYKITQARKTWSLQPKTIITLQQIQYPQ